MFRLKKKATADSRHKESRGQDRSSENGSALANVSTHQRPYKPQESAVSPPKKVEKTTLCYPKKADYFSGPQDLSEEDNIYQQAFRYGAR